MSIELNLCYTIHGRNEIEAGRGVSVSVSIGDACPNWPLVRNRIGASLSSVPDMETVHSSLELLPRSFLLSKFGMDNIEESVSDRASNPRVSQACQRCRTLKTRCLPSERSGTCRRYNSLAVLYGVAALYTNLFSDVWLLSVTVRGLQRLAALGVCADRRKIIPRDMLVRNLIFKVGYPRLNRK